MNKKTLLEMVWWIVTIIITLLILLPIITSVGSKYVFYVANTILIVLFITFSRYIFLLRHTFIARRKKWKIALIFLPILLFFYVTDTLFDFQDFLDKEDHIKMLSHLSADKAMEISKYIKYQFLFFGTGAMFVIFLLPVRMIISVWREINKGTI